MIISMDAAVRSLDEQKKELEKVISALKQEEAEEEGIGAETAEVGIVDAADGDAAMDDAVDGDAAVNDEDGGDTEELEVTESSTSF
jgi:peptidoglycan hydrolase CwlO-like protein